MSDLSKGDKKILRKAIDIGLQKDYVTAITALDAIITQWKENKLDNREAYGTLFGTMRDNDKLIARRYDALPALITSPSYAYYMPGILSQMQTWRVCRKKQCG